MPSASLPNREVFTGKQFSNLTAPGIHLDGELKHTSPASLQTLQKSGRLSHSSMISAAAKCWLLAQGIFFSNTQKDSELLSKLLTKTIDSPRPLIFTATYPGLAGNLAGLSSQEAAGMPAEAL